MVEKNEYAHKHYTHCKDEKDADAVAWAFMNKTDVKKFPFKFEELGDDELRANITYTGLCYSDVHTGRSHWGPAQYPIAPGHEVVGVVSKIGKNVKGWKVGERVAYGPFRNCCEECKPCMKGDDNLCQGMTGDQKLLFNEYWGGYASAIQQPAKFGFKIPENLPSDKTPPLMCAGVTVHAPLARFAKPGDKVAVIGIGGLGHLAVMYANKFGCHVTAFSSTKGKEKSILDLGAHEVISSTDPEALKNAASGYDVVINSLSCANEKQWGAYLDLTAPQGTFVQVGAPPVSDKFQFHAFQIIPKNISIAGSGVGSRKETKAMLEFSARHNILPVVEMYGFEDFPKAIDTLENGRPVFRCVVNVEEWSKKNNFFKSY